MDQWSKTTSHQKTGFGYLAMRIFFPIVVQACEVRPLDLHQLQGHLQDRTVIAQHLLQTRFLHRQHHQVIMRLENERIELKVIPLQCLYQLILTIERCNQLWTEPTKIPKTNQKGNQDRTGQSVSEQLSVNFSTLLE